MKIIESYLFIVVVLNLGLGINPSFAQFKDYKAKTKFNTSASPGDSSNTVTVPPKGNAAQTDPDRDIFGHGTGIQKSQAAAKDSKYVNLNPETAFGPEVVTSFDFPNTDIMEITKHMQKLTGINLIMDNNVKGKITILAPSPITVGDAWKAYLTALNLNGLSLVRSGAFYKVVQVKDIRYTPTKIYTGNFTPETDNYVMRIIPLKYISAKEIDRSFRPFMSRYGRMINIQQTNTIIIHDTGANINRLVKLIKFLDVPGHDESLQVFQVKHSSAQEIAKLLAEILKPGKAGGRFNSANGERDNISKIIAEPRTNSIIAMANSDGAKELIALIKKLDVRLVASASGKIHVYYLLYGDAEKVATTLKTIVSGATSSTKKTSRFASQSTASGLFNDDVKIEPDKGNNALVVTASPTDWLTVKSVIDKLDIPRDQVYVEGLIMETAISKNNSFGISIVGAYGSGGAQRGAIGNVTPLLQLLTTKTPASIGGLFTGFGIGKSIKLNTPSGEVTVNGVNGLITAIANNTNSNVLATPQVLALDNEKANFQVGETRPVRTQSTNPNGTTSVTTDSQEVGLQLEITPHINKVTRFIRLEINQNISEFDEGGLNSEGIGSRTTQRAATTQAIVRDRDTVAMGGLMRDKTTYNASKVPLLGDIPVLGWLFKSQSKVITKVNLLFFLTPKILASYESTQAKNVKDLLNRRNIHLKDVIGEEDPFSTTTKGLYKKAKKQDEGPLYPEDASFQFLKSNEDRSGIGSFRDDMVEDEQSSGTDSPDYQKIVNDIETAKATKKSGQKSESEQATDNTEVNPDFDAPTGEHQAEKLIDEGGVPATSPESEL